MVPGESVHLGPGEVVTCVASARDGGAFEFELTLDAGVKGPPVHHHPEDEEVQVREGEVVFVMDGARHHLRAGDTLVIPAGVPHTFWVPRDTGRLVAFGRHGARFEKVVDQHGGGGPAFTRMAMYLRGVDPHASYMVNPAVRALLAVVAWVGRIRGVRLHPVEGAAAERAAG